MVFKVVESAMAGYAAGRRLKIKHKTIDYKTAKKYNLPEKITEGKLK